MECSADQRWKGHRSCPLKRIPAPHTSWHRAISNPWVPTGEQPELALQHPCHWGEGWDGLFLAGQRDSGEKQSQPQVRRGAGMLLGRAVPAQSPPQLHGLRALPTFPQPFPKAHVQGLGQEGPACRFRRQQWLPGVVDDDNNFSSTLLSITSSPMTGGSRFCEGCFFTHSVTDIKLT